MAPHMPPGQKGKGQGLPFEVADAQVGKRAHGHAVAAAAQLLQEEAIAGAPASHQQLQRHRAATQILGHGGRREGREGGQGIGGRGPGIPGPEGRQALPQIGGAIALAPGGFWRRLEQVGLPQPGGEQLLGDPSLAGPIPPASNRRRPSLN